MWQVPTFVKKVLQFYETLIVRHGVMLVGPTGGGKTTNRDIMAASLTSLGASPEGHSLWRPVQQFTVNPKSISYGELYGNVNALTQEWHDGVLVVIVKEVPLPLLRSGPPVGRVARAHNSWTHGPGFESQGS